MNESVITVVYVAPVQIRSHDMIWLCGYAKS